MHKLFAATILLLLGACADSKNCEAVLNSWNGSPETDLIASWGAPTFVFEAGTTKYITFDRSLSTFLQGQAPTQYQTTTLGYRRYTTAYNSQPSTELNFNCMITFTIESGIIAGGQYEGNSCVQ